MKSIRNFQWMNEQMTDHLPTSTGRTLGQIYQEKKKKKKKKTLPLLIIIMIIDNNSSSVAFETRS